jgi:mannose-6-phosphate isomerase-like protein (cupin superfamily)
MEPVNLMEKLEQFQDFWHPRIVGELNNSYVKLAKLKGEFVWHQHHDEDELFFVIKGTLKMCIRDEADGCTRTLTVEAGEFLIVPKGVKHYPIAEDEVHVLLMEPKTTVNTGDVTDERTREAEWL